MKILGFRCSNSDYTYAILEGNKEKAKVVAVDTILYPRNQKWPETLVWFSLEVQEHIDKYLPEGILIKRTDVNSLSDAEVKRIEMEGVVTLCARNKGIKYIDCKRKRTIAKDIGYKGTAENYGKAFGDGCLEMSCMKKASPKIVDAILVARSGL